MGVFNKSVVSIFPPFHLFLMLIFTPTFIIEFLSSMNKALSVKLFL